MACDNNAMQHRCNSIVDELIDHIDSVVVIYTGCFCYTGLLVGVNCDACKLITRTGNNRCGFGKITIIRVCSIDAVTFCNTSF